MNMALRQKRERVDSVTEIITVQINRSEDETSRRRMNDILEKEKDFVCQ